MIVVSMNWRSLLLYKWQDTEYYLCNICYPLLLSATDTADQLKFWWKATGRSKSEQNFIFLKNSQVLLCRWKSFFCIKPGLWSGQISQLERSLPSSCDSCQNPAESGGIKFGRQFCQICHSGDNKFRLNLAIPELRPDGPQNWPERNPAECNKIN